MQWPVVCGVGRDATGNLIVALVTMLVCEIGNVRSPLRLSLSMGRRLALVVVVAKVLLRFDEHLTVAIRVRQEAQAAWCTDPCS